MALPSGQEQGKPVSQRPLLRWVVQSIPLKAPAPHNTSGSCWLRTRHRSFPTTYAGKSDHGLVYVCPLL